MSRSAGALLAGRLRSRLPEIERTTFIRIRALKSSQGGDPEYALGLRNTVQAALEYALNVLEHGEQGAGPPPAALLEQARKAARNQVSLDTVLRRYLAGHALLLDLVIEEASAARAPRDALQEILSIQATLLDRLLGAVAEEHAAEVETLNRDSSTRARRLRTVERMLAGESVPAPELRYELANFHTALIVSGTETKPILREIAVSLDRNLLVARPDEASVWAWLGGRRPLPSGELVSELRSRLGSELTVAVGEAGEGIAGWRQSHQQACAAWPIARRGPDSAVRYADVAILASILEDDLLLDSLWRLYLEPLEVERDRGATLRETLRAYFVAERSAASAAAALGVSRQTVNTRLRTAEEHIGRPLGSCGSELEAVLRVEEFREHPNSSLGLSPDKKPVIRVVASQAPGPKAAGSMAADVEKRPRFSLGKEFAQ
jgi:hypothetical protein